MKYIIGKHTVLGLLAALIVLLTGCQSDSVDTVDTPRQNPTMEMQAYATTYKDVVPKASTRAGGWWPSGFELYEEQNSIRIAFVTTTSIAKSHDSTDDADGSFVFVPGDKTVVPNIPDKWMSSFVLPSTGSYYLYGYMPSTGNLTLTPVVKPDPAGTSYDNGANMTITGLPTATSSDVCVIVGVKKGANANDGSGIIMGQFGYTIDGETNHVFLLCDHIYAALNLSIKVDATYNALRTIKLKKVWVKDCKNSSGGTFSLKSNVAITLEKSNTGITNPSLWVSPIKSISFTNDGSNSVTNMEQTPLFKAEGDGLELTTSDKYVQGYMAPIGMTEFTLVSQYDVYDTKGNLIRENQTAANKININQIFSTQLITVTEFERGTRYTLKLKVNPTYLYMLSEPDLNNPTVEVES